MQYMCDKGITVRTSTEQHELISSVKQSKLQEIEQKLTAKLQMQEEVMKKNNAEGQAEEASVNIQRITEHAAPCQGQGSQPSPCN